MKKLEPYPKGFVRGVFDDSFENDVQADIPSDECLLAIDECVEFAKRYCGVKLLPREVAPNEKTTPSTNDVEKATAPIPIRTAALKEKYSKLWPAIESHLKHAKDNGLVVAKVRHGQWNEAKAIEWAEKNSAMTKPKTIQQSPFPT